MTSITAPRITDRDAGRIARFLCWLRGGRDRQQSVSGTLKPGQTLTAGNVRIDNVGGLLILGVGKDFAVTILPIGSEYNVPYKMHCYSDGDRLPAFSENQNSKIQNQKSDPPLVRIGQGDYAQDYNA